MTNPRELLRRRGAPAPIAVTMQTEIRSDGGLLFTVLQSPLWAYKRYTATIWQWTAMLGHKEVRLLWEFLRDPDPVYAMQPEALIDLALATLQIGRYVGTYVDAGTTPVVVRMVFGIEPDRQVTETQLNRQIRTLVDYSKTNNAPKMPDGSQLTRTQLDQMRLASVALLKLRQYWADGTTRTEQRSVMMTGVELHDLDGGGQSPFGDGGD